MDTTRVDFIAKQLDRIVETLAQHPNGLSTGVVAIIAAIIGASAAIITQFVAFRLTNSKERRNLKDELIADERRIAYLLAKLYRELVMHKVHKTYWYRTYELDDDSSEGKSSHKRHFISNQRSFKTISEINITTSEYFKIVTHFTILTGINSAIKQELENIKTFQPRKASRFNEVRTYNELWSVAVPKEEKALNEVYLYYSDCFDRIHNEMIRG